MVNERMKKLGEERSAIRELFEFGNARKAQIGKENVYDFSLGNPNVPAPDCVREEIERLVKETPAAELHGYTSAPGDLSVRRAVASYLQSTHSFVMREDLVYMTCGAAASLTILLNALHEEGDEFIVLTPCFPEYAVFIEGAGGKTVRVRTDENFHLDLAAIERAISVRTKALLINSPNNPTGAVYGEKEIKGLAKLLERKSAEFGKPIFLISDEPYRELVYGKEPPFLPCYYANTVVCYSFSKSLSLAGERIGYIAISPKCTGAEALFAAVCGAGRSLGYVCAPALFQRVCAKCLGKTGDVSVYASNRELLYNSLTALGFACVLPEGAFYLFVKSPEPSAAAFSERAKWHEILIVPSDSFGVEGYARISYCVSRETILRALPAFRKLAKEYGLKG